MDGTRPVGVRRDGSGYGSGYGTLWPCSVPVCISRIADRSEFDGVWRIWGEHWLQRHAALQRIRRCRASSVVGQGFLIDCSSRGRIWRRRTSSRETSGGALPSKRQGRPFLSEADVVSSATGQMDRSESFPHIGAQGVFFGRRVLCLRCEDVDARGHTGLSDSRGAAPSAAPSAARVALRAALERGLRAVEEPLGAARAPFGTEAGACSDACRARHSALAPDAPAHG